MTETSTKAPMKRAAFFERMPAWADRVFGLGFPTWWGRVEVSLAGAATVAVVNTRMTSLQQAAEIADRIEDDLHPRRYYTVLAAVAATAVGLIAAGVLLIKFVGGWAHVPAIILIFLGAFLAIPLAQHAAQDRQLPAGTYVRAKLDESTWATFRYLNSYRNGPDEQRNAARALMYTIAQAASYPNHASTDVTAALADIASTTHQWTELPAADLYYLTGRVQQALTAQQGS